MSDNPSLKDALLRRISEFCAHHKMSRGEFGLQAVEDRDCVRDLERGIGSLARIERIERFMATLPVPPPAPPISTAQLEWADNRRAEGGAR